jgi:hypothetical protein
MPSYTQTVRFPFHLYFSQNIIVEWKAKTRRKTFISLYATVNELLPAYIGHANLLPMNRGIRSSFI